MKYCIYVLQCGIKTESHKCRSHHYCNFQVDEQEFNRRKMKNIDNTTKFDFDSINKEMIEYFWNETTKDDFINKEQFIQVSNLMLKSQRNACMRDYLYEKTILNGNSRDLLVAIQDAEITKEDIENAM